MGEHAHLLVAALAHSGRWRAVLAESEDFLRLVQALDDVVRKLGGTACRWRFDRMATVCYPPSGQVTAAFAAVAKYYGAGVDICPPRRGNRKGVVEKANHEGQPLGGATLVAHGSRRPHGHAGPVWCRQALAPDGRPAPGFCCVLRSAALPRRGRHSCIWTAWPATHA